MKSFYWKLGVALLLLLPFGLGLFGGCGSCIPETILPKAILIDDIHWYEGYEPNYDGMISTLQEMGYTVKLASEAGFNPSLFTYRTVLLPAPFQAYTSEETQALTNFVRSGGKVIMLGEYGGYQGGLPNTNLNSLSTSLGAGITFKFTTVSDTTNNYLNSQFWPLISDFVNHPTTTGLEEIVFMVGCSLETQSPAIPIAYASSTATEIFPEHFRNGNIIVAAVSQVNLGKVIAIGDTGLFSDDYDFLDLYDNKQFFKNIINW